jgi:hypothetical protein
MQNANCLKKPGWLLKTGEPAAYRCISRIPFRMKWRSFTWQRACATYTHPEETEQLTVKKLPIEEAWQMVQGWAHHRFNERGCYYKSQAAVSRRRIEVIHLQMPIKQSSLIIGRQPLVEALQGGRAIDKILLQKNISGDVINTIRQLAREHNVPIQVVPPEKLDGMTKANHQGVVAFVARVQYMDLQQVIDHTVSNGELPLFLMLDGVTDVRNIGAIARSAVCCGAQAIIIPDKGVGALNEEAMKSSAGALEQIHICRVNSLIESC